ncbi:SCP2 sterol-binding domain-containing protein [Aestuariibacter sp. AA17]|uniref:Ubiquinone biosynthesis accessory factor UbiJ n=1 Tax=Fluctibacter corallii TaxID=2984329 RepID=A0ABT3A7J2_9ALTE|nr:SCP2 sterol-binding domain-containing protein [Aestuariibacter sp. AA17]MCV2884578.1 SCP2 sterol-binding domain-containing protein [Aestuariibacter sp. AA17]
MPTPQLISALVETSINGVLALDAKSHERLKGLSGKRLWVHVRELPWPLTFCFSQRIDVLVDSDIEALSETPLPADCCLSLSLTTLPLLQDSSQITKLIKQDKLELMGDIHVAQGFSQLLSELNIDLEEKLSSLVGDVGARLTFQRLGAVKTAVTKKAHYIKTIIRDGAIEEKHIVASPIAIAHFCDEVNMLRSDVERLEAKLSLLEHQVNPSTDD